MTMISVLINSIDAVVNGKTEDCAVQLQGNNCTVWVGMGSARFDGAIDDLQSALPGVFAALVNEGAICAR